MKKIQLKYISVLLTTATLISLAAAWTVPIGASSVTTNKPFNFKTYTEADHGIVKEGPKKEDVPEVLPDPVILDFSSFLDLSKSKAQLSNPADGAGGKYKFVTLDDGTKCLRLDYAPSTVFGAYRFMPGFYADGVLNTNYKYIRVTFMTNDPVGGKLTLSNPATSVGKTVLMENTAVSKGEWVRTNAVNISGTNIIESRLSTTKHIALHFSTTSTDTNYYIKEVGFFGSEAQAYEYYGDEASAGGSTYTVLSFGKNETGITRTGEAYNYGVHEIDEDGVLNLTWTDATVMRINYLAKIRFATTYIYNKNHIYTRVLYCADNPDGVESCSMFLYNDGTGDTIRTCENVVDTNGEYVLSETVVVAPSYPDRLSKTNHLSLVFNAGLPGGKYSVKAIYFFGDREAAESFTVDGGNRKVSISGNDISKYKVVVADNCSPQITESAEALVKQIEKLSGVKVPIVSDNTAVAEYEILVGRSSRPLSYKLADTLADRLNGFAVDVEGNTLIISSPTPGNTDKGMDAFLTGYLYKGVTVIPDEINISGNVNLTGISDKLKASSVWKASPNVADPKRFTDDFESDTGYFTEENNANNFVIKNGTLTAAVQGKALTYIHVYERNATVTARLKYSNAGSNGTFGIMQRYTAEDAWVRAGYNAASGEWFIENREGIDFNLVKSASVTMPIKPETWYDVTFTVDGTAAQLYINGTVVLTANGITQKTPGRPAVYAENITLAVDRVDMDLLTAESPIIKNITHTRLVDDKYLEGGTVLEMKDGSLIYHNSKNVSFRSLDGGLSWAEAPVFTNTGGYPNILRLNNGDFIKIITDGNYTASYTSSDDGVTWVKGGNIALSYYMSENGIKANQGNVNDKLFQSGTTDRIFYVQSYSSNQAFPDGTFVFCEFYFSDDNGKTWTKSKNDSRGIEGNEKQAYFGECKILECADGTLRMYCSWNEYGCIVYSESSDNGETWGPLVKMPEFICARSSMQFVRDPYADNDTTYYMVWVNSPSIGGNASTMTRSRLSLARSFDGKEWEYIGDIWRWESNYTAESGGFINHIVDPVILATKDRIIIGTGLSEQLSSGNDYTYHQGQRQHIWSVDKSTLPDGVTVNKFIDVAMAASYNDAVTFVTDQKLFQGTSDTAFSPDTTMTRAMFVTVLGRLDGIDTSAYVVPTFNDVQAEQWYTPYVEWAAANGIVNGIGNGLYGVDNEVTVQQACVILARYADYKTAENASGKTATDYADGAAVASWAQKEVDWALVNGVYTGYNGKLDPQSPATRAMVAVMFNNYVKAFGK